MGQSKPEIVKAILACIFSNPSSSDEQVRRSVPDSDWQEGKTWKGEVRWFRRYIYRVIRFMEEGAAAWNIPPESLFAKHSIRNGKREMELITAVIYAVMRHPNLKEQVALARAGVEKTGDAKGYALEGCPIIQEVKGFGEEKRKRYRNSLCEQMRLSVGKKLSQNWKDKLERQIAMLKGLRA